MIRVKQHQEIVVITGASAGVGRATVREFAKRGAAIGLLARGKDGLAAAKREVEHAGGKALVLPIDVSDAAAVDQAASAVEQAFGPIDVWVNDAMVSVFSPFKEMTAEEFRRVTEVTYLGFVHGTMSALKRMLPRDRGTIVQVGSALAYRGIPLQSAYCGAKHAMLGFTESVRCELIHDKSRVWITMVQMPALNTTQFGWVKSRLPRKPQPVPPIFQPEVAAEAIYWAAHRRRRQVYVGALTVVAIEGNKVLPGTGDKYLGATGYDSQMTEEPTPPDRVDNLWEPVPGDHGAHGAFVQRAHSWSPQLWATMHRPLLALAGLGIAGVAIAKLLSGALRLGVVGSCRATRHSENPSEDAAMTQLPKAPGAPGAMSRWTVAAKTGVGSAIEPESRVWFSLSEGVVTEVFYPSVDKPAIRQLGFVVTDRRDFLSDETQDVDSEVTYIAEGVPAFRLRNRCRSGRYELEKTILADPRRSVLLQKITFRPLQAELSDYALFALLEPHLGNRGSDNTAWLGEFKGIPMLFAERAGYTLALACSAPWLKRSAGFVGSSDGHTDLVQHKRLDWTYGRAEDGNVALTGEVDLAACEGTFVLALSFGRSWQDAGHRARASLLQTFAAAEEQYRKSWQKWQQDLLPLEGSQEHEESLYRISAAVMQTHESKDYPGGIVASLAIPWGFARGDKDSGYHRVWPRDMIQTVGGMLAIRGHENARRVLFYLHVTQEADGHWPQNMEVNGEPSWTGIQLDETAFVILLVDLARREGALRDVDLEPLWTMVRKAVAYLVCHGPVTPLDRWEEQAGYFASTLSVEIAALLTAAHMADEHNEPDLAEFLRETADAWNDEIEPLLYVTGTEVARQARVDGYYVRFANPGQRAEADPAHGRVTLQNHHQGAGQHPVNAIVSPDALALVRFGLRSATDPRIVNTVKVIDHLLRVETPGGAGWRRYNDDGYGEHSDGSPFDGTGIGRLWPLLTGERAHYELAAGRRDAAAELLTTMESFANASGLFPEQIWDSPDIPARKLRLGRPSGSAMPLVWAHAEYVKLRRSLEDGNVFDMPQHARQRYENRPAGSPTKFWRFEQPCESIGEGQKLRIEVLAPAQIRWSDSNWHRSLQTNTIDTGLGLHYADLPIQQLEAGEAVRFTFYWPDVNRWEGENFVVRVVANPAQATDETNVGIVRRDRQASVIRSSS